MSDPSETQILAYLAGELPSDEAAQVHAYLAASSGRSGTVAGFLAAIRMEDIGPSLDVAASHARLHDRLNRLDAASVGRSKPAMKAPPTMRRSWVISLAAATICVMAGLGLSVHSSTHSVPADSIRTYQTTAQQTSTIRAIDGIVMTLAPATTVRMREDRIEVTGKAVFAMVSNARRPFVVQTSRATVRVLGTSFMVRQYPGDAASEVVVGDGKVEVVRLTPTGTASDGPAMPRLKPVVLSARMLARVSDSSMTVTSEVEVKPFMDVTQTTLQFNRVPLRDVVAALGQVYGATIRVRDSAQAGQPLILDVSPNRESLASVLDVIGQVVDARAVFDGNPRSYVLIPGYVKSHVPVRSPLPRPEVQYGK